MRLPISVLGVLVVVATAFGVPAPAAEPAQAEVENLGVPIHVVTAPGGAVGPGPGGERYLYTVTSGQPAMFNVLDATSGESVATFPVEGADGAWGITVDPDGVVYFGTYFNASLYRWVPGSDDLENLGQPVPGTRFVWRVTTDEQGRVYGGAQNHGFRYDPETGEFHDYGVIVPGESTVRSVAHADGTVYWGVGEHPHLVAMDAATGEKREIPLPPDLTEPPNSYVYDLNVVDGMLFARVESSRTLLVYDLAAERFVHRIDNTYGLDVSPRGGPRRQVYFIKNGELVAFDTRRGTVRPTGFRPTPRENKSHARGYGWVHLDEPGWPLQTLVSMTGEGEMWWYNPRTGRSRTAFAELEAEPVVVLSLGRGPDGQIYSGGYFSGGLGVFDPATGEMGERRTIGQIESFLTHDETIYMGIYPWAWLLSYDPSRAWDYGANPVEHFNLHDEGQNRPVAMVPVDGRIAIGTTPDYGRNVGALTFFDPGTGEVEVHRGIVGEASPTALTERDGMLYGGTVAYGSTPAAVLFAVDPETGEKIWEGTPVPGGSRISALTWGPDGMLWGMNTSGDVFTWNPETREFGEKRRLFPDDAWDPGVDRLLWVSHLEFDAEAGVFYGTTKGNLFRLDPSTWEIEVLAEDAYALERDRCGNLYFSRDAELYRYALGAVPCTVDAG